MTIREWICKNEARMYAERLEKLEAMKAPAVVVNGLAKMVEELKAGIIKVSGDDSLLDVEVASFENKKGNGGKPYVTINGTINYFPVAKYGRYIALATK